jgi:hypothetical protein
MHNRRIFSFVATIVSGLRGSLHRCRCISYFCIIILIKMYIILQFYSMYLLLISISVSTAYEISKMESTKMPIPPPAESGINLDTVLAEVRKKTYCLGLCTAFYMLLYG